MKTTSFLLATSAIVGVTAFAATPAFAQVTTATGGGGTTISDAATLDANQNTNLFLGTASETITAGESATQTIGDGAGDALTAEHGAAATTLTINNTGASVDSTLNVAGNVQKEATQDLNLAVSNAVTQDLNVAVDGNLAIGNGTLGVTSSANATDFAVTGNKTGTGAITLNGTGGGVASLTLNGSTAQTINGTIDANTGPNTGIVVNNDAGVTFGGIVGGTTAVDTLTVTSGDANFGAAATFAGNVAGSGTMTNAAGINVGGDITVSGVNLGASGALTLDGSAVQTVSSTIDGVADTNGSITVNNTGGATFNGAIGGTNTVGALTITAGDTELAADAEFSGNVSVNTGQTLTNNAGLTVGGVLSGAGDFTNSADATTTVTGDVTNTGTIANAGTLSLKGSNNAATINNNGRLNIASPLTNSGTIDLSATANKATTVGLTGIADGQTAIDTSGTVSSTGTTRVLLDPSLNADDVVKLNGDATLDAAYDAGRIIGGNALRKVTFAKNTGIEMTVGATATAAETASTLGVSVANGSKLNQAGQEAVAGNLSTAGFAQTQTDVLAALTSDSATAKSAAERLGDATAAAGAASDAGVQAFTAGGRSIGNRLASLRGGETSVAAGNQAASNNVWFEGHASRIDQDARKGAAGFEVDSFGGTVGADTEVSNNSRVGVAFTYSNSDVDGDGAANVAQDVDSYIVNLYGERQLGSNFMNGGINFGVQEVQTSQNVIGFTGRGVGNYTNTQYGANIEFGREIAMGENSRIVPTAGLSYARIGADSVSLTDGTNTVEDSFSARDAVIGKIGARYEMDYQTDGGALMRPSVHGSYSYDLAGDEVTSTRSFGSVLVSDRQADIAQSALGFGAAFTYETPSRMTAVQVGYEGELRDEYFGHTGKVRLSVRF